ncbi:MAG: DUF166 family protein, partial [Chloroflexota bacterium]
RLPLLIDEPEDFLPTDIPETDLLLALSESEGAAQLVPAIARRSHARAVILPVDDGSWLPPGLQNQVQEELKREGMSAVFPRTFCTLTGDYAGYGSKSVPYSDEFISAFARYFGRPQLQVTIDQSGEIILAVAVKRGAPCGSTHHVASLLVGMPVAEILPRAGLLVHQFPCLASMQTEEIDTGVFEPLMSVSGYVMNEELARKIGHH